MVCSLAVLFVILVSRYYSCSGQSFTIHPQSSLQLKGRDVTLTCQATGLANPSYFWLKNGVNFSRGTTGIKNVKAFLTISTLTFQDAGSYACRAVGNANTITSNSAQLKVVGKPEIVQPPSPTTSHEGYTVYFTCGALGNPSPVITWYYGGREITSVGRFTIRVNGSLVISNLVKSDAGTYSCKAKNSYGNDGGFADLRVLDPPLPPTFTTIPQNASATEGTTVVFYCQASGSPIPIIHWKRILGEIPSDRRSHPRPGALGISSLKPSDYGWYACVANNSQGEKTTNVYLSIKGYPKFVVTPASQVIKEYDAISFNCTADSDPTPEISWQIPSGAIVSKDRASSGNIQVLLNNTLSIATVKEQDEGKYTCIASNSVGTRVSEATLSVLTIPRFTTSLQNVTKTRGQDLVITCPARANPSPSFQWIYKNNIIEMTQVLRLTSVDVSNEGTYTCRVNNSMGASSGDFFLRIIVIPVITLKPSNQTIGIGKTARFSCRSSGDPNPSITWYKSGILVTQTSRYSILTNNTLVITNAIYSDKGWFTCRSTNAAGIIEAKAYLFITDSPKFTGLPSNTTVDIGRPLTVRCRAVALETPRISWFKLDKAGRFIKVAPANVLISGDLQIISTQRSDRATYVCQACNAAGCVTTLQVFLNVLYYPSFLVPPKDVGVLQSEDAVLKCEPDSSPKASITWRLPNGQVFGGKEYEQIVYDVQPGNIGDYTCEAKNYLGNAGPVTITLSIQTKSMITDFTRRVMPPGKETITCNTLGIPSPKVVWYVGKDALPSNAKYPNYIVTYDKELQVPIGSLDNENFLCNATNPQNSDVYFVKVPVAPSSVSIADITSSSMRVTWVRPSSKAYLVTHYELEKWSADGSWELVNDNITDLSYTVSQLSAYTMYQFRLKAVNGLGKSPFSTPSDNSSTLSSSPSRPRNVVAKVINSSKINVSWSVPLNLHGPLNNINYRVTYFPKLPNMTNDFNVSHDGANNLQMYILSGLEADIQYNIKVFAWRLRREDGATLMSSGVSSSARTLQIVPSSPPIGLVVVSNGPHQIIAKWERPPYSVRGYNILFMEYDPGSNFTKINIANGAATTHVIMELKESTVYIIKIQMYSNVDDEGPFSDAIEVRTATDEFASAGLSDTGRTVSWEVAVGGLVCGILLIVVVSIIVWCWLKKTRQTNQTFQISTRRRRAPSSIGSQESFEGQYNVGAFNAELDTDLDLEMFANGGNVVPVSTSFHNERAIAYLNPAIVGESNDYDAVHQTQNIYDNEPPTRSVIYGKSTKVGNSNVRNNPNAHKSDYQDDDITYAQINTTRKSNNSPPVDVVPELQDSDYALPPDAKPLEEVKTEPPTYAQVDMSKKTPKQSNTSDDVPEYPDYDSDNDIPDDIPFPDEALPPLERTWTNVSEFNFPPPPPDDPPPFIDQEEEYPANTPEIVPIQDDPSFKPLDNDPSIPKDNGNKKKRMVASWAEADEEPMGNLWEAVDKELDRRLGTT